MEDQSEVKADPSPIIEDENLKKAAKKGVSITISLVMLGFSGWKDLEPGLFWNKKYFDELPSNRNIMIEVTRGK